MQTKHPNFVLMQLRVAFTMFPMMIVYKYYYYQFNEFILWTSGLLLASRHTKFYKIPIFGLLIMSQNAFFFPQFG
jgi:hypothetical protein